MVKARGRVKESREEWALFLYACCKMAWYTSKGEEMDKTQQKQGNFCVCKDLSFLKTEGVLSHATWNDLLVLTDLWIVDEHWQKLGVSSHIERTVLETLEISCILFADLLRSMAYVAKTNKKSFKKYHASTEYFVLFK
jgi:hypothetical protein